MGAFSSSSDSTFDGMVRNTAAAPRFWTNALTRKRARFGIANEKSHSRFSSYALRCASFMMSYTMACTSLCSIGGRLMRRTSPWTRIIGGRPADRCRSEALFLTAKASSSVMSIYNPRGRKRWVAVQHDGGMQFAYQPRQSHAGVIRLCSTTRRRGKTSRIASGRRRRTRGVRPRKSMLLAVSKRQPPEAIRVLHAARPTGFRRELRAGSARQDGRARRPVGRSNGT